jgi:uncharacterized lipoprotein YmbA
LKIIEVAQIFGPVLTTEKSYVLISAKNCWATILAIFSKTQLVTLLSIKVTSTIVQYLNASSSAITAWLLPTYIETDTKY